MRAWVSEIRPGGIGAGGRENGLQMRSLCITPLCVALLVLGLGWAITGVAEVDPLALDLEPPLIEHTPLDVAEAGIRQQFVATVVDDDELGSVRFYYRFQGEPIYSELTMRRISYSSTYIAEILTDPDSDRAIQYYLQAEDRAGNRTLRGYAFSPITRRIVLPSGPVAADVSAVPASATSGGIATRTKILYGVLGILAVGALVAATQDDDGVSTRNCPDGRCTIDITLDSPVTQ